MEAGQPQLVECGARGGVPAPTLQARLDIGSGQERTLQPIEPERLGDTNRWSFEN